MTAELNDLLGLPSDAVLEVTEAGLPELTEPLKDEAYEQARDRNGELLAARETLEKSRHAVQAAKDEYIPDVTLFAKHGYQDGAAFLEDNIGIVGVELSWNIFDWGKRKGEIGQRVAQQSQAKENLARIDKRIGIEIDKVFRKMERSAQMVDVAREALSLRKENARLDEKRHQGGDRDGGKACRNDCGIEKGGDGRFAGFAAIPTGPGRARSNQRASSPQKALTRQNHSRFKRGKSGKLGVAITN